MADLRFMKAEKARDELTQQQLKDIKKLYSSVHKDFAKQIKSLQGRTNISSILRQQYLESMSKDLSSAIKSLDSQIETQIKSSVKKTAEAVVKESQARLSQMGLDIVGAYGYIPDDVVSTIVSGQLYESKWSLSKGIWQSSKRAQSDIHSIVARGIASNKDTYSIAKDLEQYVNPEAQKQWSWSKVYPNVRKTVDYSAQRLARTMINHAYQESFERATEHDPFVDAYKWNTAHNNGVCPICKARQSDNKYGLGAGVFPKGKLPLDHPNGRCFITAIQSKSYMDISNDLADWVNGKENKSIDEFARSLGYTPNNLKKVVK